MVITATLRLLLQRKLLCDRNNRSSYNSGIFLMIASDKETWTGEDEELEAGVRKKKKKKIRVPGRSCQDASACGVKNKCTCLIVLGSLGARTVDQKH